MTYKTYKRASLHTQKKAVELYKKGFSANKIAEMVGYSVPAVCYWLKKHGIEIKLMSKTVQCSYCGKEKSIFPSRLKFKEQFCNRVCKGKWTSLNNCGENNPMYKPKVATECAVCAKPMMVYPSRIPETGRVFCGDSCQKEFLRERFSGELNPNWCGGISIEPYCTMWKHKQFRKDLLERDNYRCQNPDCWGKFDRLDLHHIDYDKKNCHPDNLITVCVSCNSRANVDRRWHKSWYTAIMQRSGKTITLRVG